MKTFTPETRHRVSPPTFRNEPVAGVGADPGIDSDQDIDVSSVLDDDLERLTIARKVAVDVAQVRLLDAVGELDRRQIARIDHGVSTVSWLRRFCRMTASVASGTVKTAKALSLMPLVRRAASDGAVTFDGVRLLARARDRHPEAFTIHEEVFADIATYLDTKDLRTAVGHWAQQVDRDTALDDIAKEQERTTLHVTQSYLGRWDIQGDLDVHAGETVVTALRAHTDPQNLDTTDRRTMGQRNAAAMVDICRFFLDHNNLDTEHPVVTSGGEKPHITVTVDYQTLTGVSARFPDMRGTAIDPETLRQLACDAGIVRIVLDSNSQPLDVGRKVRTIPPAIRRALELRDAGCNWTGCGAPVSWCDAHHIIHWADGGETSLTNLQLLCRKHHTATHQAGTPPPAGPSHTERGEHRHGHNQRPPPDH